MRHPLVAPLCAFLVIVATAAMAQAPVGPSVRDIVEFKQIVQPVSDDSDALRDQVSPDGTHAFVVTRQADVASDTSRYEILLMDLTPQRLLERQVPKPVAVFATALAHDNSGAWHSIRDVQWHGDRTLVFMGRLHGEAFQVYSLDVPTRRLVQLTHEENQIVSFAASADLTRVVYAVQVQNPPLKNGAHGVTVGNQSFWSVKFGQQDLRSQDRIYQYFCADTSSGRPPRALGGAFVSRSLAFPIVSVSPDGRWAVLPRWEPEQLAAWARTYPMVAELAQKFASSQHTDPLGYFSKPAAYVPRRMTAWRLADGKEQTIVDAPDDALPGTFQFRSDRVWQATGSSVVLAGTHLPIVAGKQESPDSHVIEYWPDTGKWTVIATLHGHLTEAHALRDGVLVIEGETRREFRRDAAGRWREAGSLAPATAGPGQAWTLHIAQGLNQPPDVYASGPAGENVRLTMLNPQFNADSWGTMQPYTWQDVSGAQWQGGLMAANGSDTRTRHPLLIQAYEFDPTRFYLDGPNEHAGATSAFAGRAFLREGFLVLGFPWNPVNGPAGTERLAQQAFNAGVRGAVETLVREGRVDPQKVGIIGWSATGQRVLNLLTFDDLPIRAATMADGDANTLFSLAVTYGSSDSMWGTKEKTNEGLPFGETLASWVRNDPAMHTDCIHAALRIETYGPWVLNNWDIYGLLRRQYKPAEMVVIPGGTHSLGTPGDRMASLQGNVDWYGFWLAGRSRHEPLLPSETTETLATQYRHWQQMETLKAADDARLRCGR